MTQLARCAIAAALLAPWTIAADAGDQMPPMTPEPMFVLVGTYTGSGSEGIYTLRRHPDSGALEPVSVAGGIANPSFLAVHPSLRYVYAVQETGDGNAVFAFALDHRTGTLEPLGSQAAHGAHPCHVAVDPTGSAVVVANYSGGSVAAFPVLEGGALGPAAQVVQHSGSGPNAARQEAPHAHSVTMDPTGRRVLAADLGIDRIMIYELDPDTAMLRPADPPYAEVPPGAGPRHFAFHPTGRYGYVVNELDNTVIAFAYDEAAGTLEPLQTISTLPEGWTGETSCADIHVHPLGSFLYASNRGHDSIACYRIDPLTGRLTLVGIYPSGGRTPRNFGIDPSGRHLYAANQGSGTVVQFAIDPESGALTATGHQVDVPSPVCLLFVPEMAD